MSTLLTREHLQAVEEELRRLQRLGVESVPVTDETLAQLRQRIEAQHTPADNSASQQPAPVVSSATSTMTAQEAAPTASSFPPASTPPKTMQSSSDVDGIPEPPVIELPAGSQEERWAWLRERVLTCPVCNAHVRKEMGKQVVFGVGSLQADIFFCGEAPGADEEVQGEPFVGRAGQLLTKIIQAMGLSREAVYIGNIMNWRPEMPNMASGNRPPKPSELAFCLPYLKAQVEVVQPKVIVALGATAVSGLLGPDPKRRMASIRGCWQEFAGIPLLPTYHPSYLLRSGSESNKRMVWEDMLKVMERVGLPISEKQQGYFLPKGQ